MHPLRKLREAGVPTYEQVAAILNEHVVMHSPVLLQALEGREIVARALMNSTESRDNPGEYTFEGKVDARTTVLHWRGEVEGHEIESLELITDDEEGLMLERTVAYRPFPAVRIFRDRLYEESRGLLPDDWWDYPSAGGATLNP